MIDLPAARGRRIMPTVRIRLIGSEADARALVTLLHGVQGIAGIERVAERMPRIDAADPGAGGLAGDLGPGRHAIAIEVPDRRLAERVREIASLAAELLGADVEFVNAFRPQLVRIERE